MADESIITYKKPGFPKITKSPSGVQTVIEYIGPTSTLEAAQPDRNATWGEYAGIVRTTRFEGIDNSDHSTLVVTMEATFDATSGATTPGTVQEITYEVDWVLFQRSMFEHPAFAVGQGGLYALTSEDIVAIDLWQNGTNRDEKKVFKYLPVEDSATYETLSTNAKYFARGLQLGQETYEDYAPVVRRTTKYSDGQPSTTDAGLVSVPPFFAGRPTGYEWRKTADRSVRTNNDTQWNQVEEWTGAKKVLTDRLNLYWAAP